MSGIRPEGVEYRRGNGGTTVMGRTTVNAMLTATASLAARPEASTGSTRFGGARSAGYRLGDAFGNGRNDRQEGMSCSRR